MPSLTTQAVADLVGGRLSGPGDLPIRGVRSLERASGDELSLCSGSRWVSQLASTGAGAVLVTEALAEAAGPACRIVVPDPAAAMAIVSRRLHPSQPPRPAIDPTARIGRGTVLGEGCRVEPYAVIGDGVRVGARARIGAHVVIGDGVVLGDDVRLDPRVTVYEGARLGARVWCKAGAVIGGTGFGYSSSADGHARLPHPGGCILEDDVEIGSSSCVDRGSLDDTIVGRGTKIDNLVHIAHNVQTGRDCLIMACVGVAGSSRIGDRVILAGQSGLIDNVTLGNDVKVGAKSAVFNSLPDHAAVSGYPARPHREFLRAVAAWYRLAPHVEMLETLAKERSDA